MAELTAPGNNLFLVISVYFLKIPLSQAFIREKDEEWLGNVDPNIGALQRYLTRDNSGVRVFEVKKYLHPELMKEVYEMSNGLSYALDDNRRWYVL